MIDSALIGFWSNADGTMEFSTDGWLYRFGTSSYFVAADGLSLTITAPNGHVTVYSRQTGSGAALTGTWKYVDNSSADIMIEEWTFGASGTYTSLWTLNGQIDSTFFGYFSLVGNQLTTRERSGLLVVAEGGQLNIDKPYDIDQVGTYSFLPNGHLSLVLNGETTDLTPVTAP